MKILHCLNSPHIGGIERLVIDLAIAQKASGLDVSILLDSRNGQFLEYLVSQDIPLLDSKIKGGFDFNPKTLYHLIHVFNTFNVVHLHSFSPLRSMAAMTSSAKTVYTIHGLSKGVRNEVYLKYVLRETLKKYFLNRMDCFASNSQYTLEMAKQHYGLGSIRTIVVLNGINFGKELESNTNIKTGTFTIGLVSKFTKRKRIDRLINAFEIFLEMGGTGRLILVGDGTEYTSIRQTIESKNLLNNVEMVGYQSQMDQWYPKFEVVVHPSDNEGFGLIGVEAYIHGKPLLCFADSGGLMEVVKSFEPENIIAGEKELAERLYYYANNRKVIVQRAEARKAYARKYFSIKRMERDYYKIYKTLTKT